MPGVENQPGVINSIGLLMGEASKGSFDDRIYPGVGNFYLEQ
jgi:hypothetical protein